MQSKLTLRMEEAVISKAKRLARKQGKSVSLLVSEYFSEQPESDLDVNLPEITSSMIGALSKQAALQEEEYRRYLETKYL